MSKFYILHDANDLQQRIHFALAHNPYLVGRKVACTVTEQGVQLTGTVTSYYQKQMAQEALRDVSGIGRIRNSLIVESTN